MKLTQKELQSILNYNKDTGLFTWKIAKGNKVKIGNEAGCKTANHGYKVIRLNDKLYLSHRLIWLYMTGEFPKHHIDHINHDRQDNKWNNIREVTQQENNKNMTKRSTNTSGTTGVWFHKQNNNWCAEIKAYGKKITLGSFKEINKAIEARKHAEQLYKFHNNHGQSKSTGL